MAPIKRKSGSKKGKSRIYICLPCGFRHEAPTGANCRRKQHGPPDPPATRTRSSRPTPALGRPVAPCTAVSPRVSSSSEDEPLEEVLQSSARGIKRAREPVEREPVMCSPYKRPRPIPAPRRPLFRPPPSVSELSCDDEPNRFEDKLRQMDEANQARCAQIAAEGREERDSMKASIVALSTLIRESLQRAPPSPVTPVKRTVPEPVTPVVATPVSATPLPIPTYRTLPSRSSRCAGINPRRCWLVASSRR